MAWPPPKPQAINLKEGFGGVVNFDSINDYMCPPGTTDDSTASNCIAHIGMTDLISCVGVYVPLEGSRFFIAHIDADTGRVDYDCSPKEGQKLKDALLCRLSDNIGNDREPSRLSTRSSFIMFDQDWWTELWTKHKDQLRTSSFVVEALKDFFQSEAPTLVNGKGFIVDSDGRCDRLKRVSVDMSERMEVHGY